MDIEKRIIKTYSRRQPITRYVSRAAFVPTYSDPAHVRDSRLNDKTLVVDNFDDTFDRLATGVVIPSPDNSLDENGIDKKKDSDVFDVFKVPLQAKKIKKPNKQDLFSRAVGVKRKEIDDGSDDSGLSDQEETHKKQVISSDDKKTKEKVKRVVKKKKHLSPVKLVTNDKLIVSESTNENVPNNTVSSSKESTETNDNFKKPKKWSDVVQPKILHFFQASTPRVDRIKSNIDIQDISPVVMEKSNEKEKKTVLEIGIQEIQSEDAAEGKHNASENFNGNDECSQSNGTDAADNFAKPREYTNDHLSKTSRDPFTSTPRVNKIRMPVNLQHLSSIISDNDKGVSGVTDKSSTISAEAANDQNYDMESNFSDDVQMTSEQKSIKSPTKLIEFHCSDVEGSEEPLSREKSSERQANQQELLASNVTNENNSQDKMKNGNDSLNSIVDEQNSLVPSADVESNTKQLLNKSPAVHIDLHVNTQSFAPSPLLFDDSECIQNEIGKSNVVSEVNKTDTIQINYSQSFSEKNEESNEERANLEKLHVEPPVTTDKNFDISTASSFYPHDWTNEYDSTYGYDQHKQNLEKDATVDSKLDEDENKNSTSGSEKINNTIVENAAVINEVSNIDNTEIQSAKNNEQDKVELTMDIRDEDNAIEDSENESDKQEQHCNASSISNEDNYDSVNAIEDNKNESHKEEQHYNAPSIPNEDNYNSVNVKKDNFQNSQGVVEEKQSYYNDEDASLDDEPNENVAKADSENLNDQSFILSAAPSKRRKTDTNEIMIFDKVEDDNANVQNEEKFLNENSENIAKRISELEVTNGENVNTKSVDNVSLAKPALYEEMIEKLHDRELRIILSRVNQEEYKSPNLSRGKPVKRKSAKRASRKSSDTDGETISRKKKQEKTATLSRVTRRSVTEDKMKQLYVQYQCKNLTIFAVRLEDQNVDLILRRSLKQKSRENSIAEDKESDSSLTNGGLSDFLSKLNDPTRVTMRRKTQRKHDRHLAAITEDQVGLNSVDKVGKKTVTSGNEKRVTFSDFKRNSEDTEDNDRKSQPIFLKPGKSWARSLSIINHFHNGKNLDELAAGRDNWRHSVQTLLSMQPEVSTRSSSQNQEETRRESRASGVSSQRGSKSMRKSSIAANSRFSMRIILSGKRSTLTDDLMDSSRISYASDRLRASRKTSLKIQRDTLIETEDDLIKSAKDIVLKRCKQTSYEPFDVCFPDSYIENCRKIGEGVYGEVFLYEDGSEKSVIKIIPVEGDQLVNCEPQKKFHEILSEIIIAEELHKLRNDAEFQTNGFVEVNRIMCVIGKYPKKLIDLWYAYDEQNKSENDCPSMFEEDQLYIVLELAHGGQDLEAYTFQNASESYAIFLQTALTLAVAEQSLEFEHRDLHWGNLLISKTEDKYSTFKLGSEEISIPTKGVKVAVIDFTLSRMSYQGCKIFNDLAADPTLFEAQGEYQFDIYRKMRDNVNNDWQQFNPFTNVLWMDYILDKMITAANYKKKTTKIHKSAIEDMKSLRKKIMNYSSAFDFVTNCKKVQALFEST